MKATILVGDVLTRIKEIPDNSIQCCVTSPPYWGLRDYGTADWEGGDPDCRHSISMPTKWNDPKRGTQVLRPEVANRGGNASSCHLCGAKRIDFQLGLEPTPEAYVENMVAVFREVRRILKDDGVLWLNLGDSYATGTQASRQQSSNPGVGANSPDAQNSVPRIGTPEGLKPKDLVGIPWRVAFALQADGWWLRQDIIWHKPNPMPESVTDRCTKAHEYLFMLTKNSRYHFDNKATTELAADGTRNKRSVWTIPTKPFRGAHFAVMPEALCEPPILATSKPDDLVFDPFTGSGTVATVALRHQRNYIGIELNPEYTQIAINRISQDQPMLNETETR